MDVNDLKTRPLHDAGAEMRVKDMNGKPTDFYIKFVGLDAKAWEQIKKETQRKAFDKKESVSVPELLAKAALDWRGLKNGEQDVLFCYESALDLFENAPYLVDQADAFISDRKNFLKPSSKK